MAILLQKKGWLVTWGGGKLRSKTRPCPSPR